MRTANLSFQRRKVGSARIAMSHNVHFSQHVVYPLFSDGTSVDETVREIKAIECEDDDEALGRAVDVGVAMTWGQRWGHAS
eukprot:Skav235832  [mRNA]  locus=scaffold1931:242994:247474:- [translate_table: standard]